MLGMGVLPTQQAWWGTALHLDWMSAYCLSTHQGLTFAARQQRCCTQSKTVQRPFCHKHACCKADTLDSDRISGGSIVGLSACRARSRSWSRSQSPSPHR